MMAPDPLSPQPRLPYSPRRMHSRDGQQQDGVGGGGGTISPGGYMLKQHITGGSGTDIHITGSEPRVWPGVFSSSVKRQSSMSETDRIAGPSPGPGPSESH